MTTTKDHLSGFLVEWHDGWDGVGGNESIDGFNGHFTFKIVSTFVELFKETDASLAIGDILTEFGSYGLIGDVVED